MSSYNTAYCFVG